MKHRLEGTPFPKLLCKCHKDRLSGTLILTHNEISKSIYLEDGAIVYASSNILDEKFGERLKASGRISSIQLEQALYLVKQKGQKLGRCFIELGFISELDLRQLLIDQVSKIIYSLFILEEGEYEFYPGRIDVNGFHLSMPTADIIFQGIRELQNPDLIKKWLGDFNRSLVPTPDPFLLFQTVTLQPAEAYIISRIDTTITLNNLIALSGIPEKQLLRTICALEMAGIIEAIEKDTFPLINISIAESMQSSTSISQIDSTLAAQLCFDLADIVYKIDQQADHYQILEISRRASLDEVKQAYREKAKKYHPDRHSQLITFDFSVKTELEKVFIRIQNAYEILGDEAKRHKYDIHLRIPEISKSISSKYSNTQEPKTSPQPASNKTQSTVYKNPPKQPPFNNYGINSQKSSRSIKFNLSTYECYKQSVEKLDSNIEQAYQYIRRAVEENPDNAEYHAQMGRVFAKMQGRNKQAEKEFLTAIDTDPENPQVPDLLVELADLYSKFGLRQRAMESLKQALNINPIHTSARQKLQEQIQLAHLKKN